MAPRLCSQRWSRLIALAIPPLSMDARLFSDYDQLRRFFDMYLFAQPGVEEIVAADGMVFIDRLWADWSPGYDAAEEVVNAKDCLRERSSLSAAISYYRAALGAPAPSCTKFEAEQRRLPRCLHSRRSICTEVGTAASTSAWSKTLRRSSRPALASRSSTTRSLPAGKARSDHRGDPAWL